MNSPIQTILKAMFLLTGVWTTNAHAEKPADRVTLKVQERWSAVFGGEPFNLHWEFTCRQPEACTLRWNHMAGQRRLAGGEIHVADAEKSSGRFTLPLRIPTVREGNVLQTRLEVELRSNNRTLATKTKRIHVFPRDPFHLRSEWLRSLHISLYDPVGPTEKQFRQAGIPFRLLSNLAALDAVSEGVLVVGEGISFTHQRGLFETLMRVASRGLPVLCLACPEGAVPFDLPHDLPRPQRLSLDREGVITRLDARLDAHAWSENRHPIMATLDVTASRSGVEWTFSDTDAGWPWLEMRFGDRGRFVWCGFGVIEHWADGPTPRFFLARLFEALSDKSPSSQPK